MLVPFEYGVFFLVYLFAFYSVFFFLYFKVKANANVSATAGQASSSVQVRADGKERVKLDASVFHFLQRSSNSVGLRVNVSQSLFPSASDLHLSMAANTSSEKCVF